MSPTRPVRPDEEELVGLNAGELDRLALAGVAGGLGGRLEHCRAYCDTHSTTDPSVAS